MNICIVSGNNIDVEFRVFRQINSLREAGHQVTLIGPSCGNNTHWDLTDAKIFKGKTGWFKGPFYYLYFFAYILFFLRRTKMDCIQVIDLPALLPTSIFYLMNRSKKKLLIYEEREFFTESALMGKNPTKKWIWKTLEKILIRLPRKIIVVCRGDGDGLQALYPIPKPIVIKSVPLFIPWKPSDYLRKTFNIPKHSTILLYVGAVDNHRGLEMIVRAQKQLAETTLIIVGDGPIKQNLLKWVLKNELNKRIIFAGQKPFQQLFAICCSADIGLIPIPPVSKGSINTLPNKFFEYVMSRLPIVASQLPEMEKLNRVHPVAEFFEPANQTSYVECIKRLLKSPSRYQSLKDHCEKAGKLWNWDIEKLKYLEIFKT